MMSTYPELSNQPEGLTRLLETGEFILFLGSGVGVEAGLPEWQTALLEIASDLNSYDSGYAKLLKSEAEAGRLLKAAELLYMAPIADASRHQIMNHVFGKKGEITRRLKLLVLTRCQGIVTTNFDDSLLRARTETGEPWVVYGEHDLTAARIATKPFLVRLHGRVEVPDGIVFAERHYRELSNHVQYVEFFRELFLNRNLIFFGFSFLDPFITELIGDMRKAVRSTFRRSAYALVVEPVNPHLQESLRAAGVIAVPYPAADRHDAAWGLLAAYRDGPPPLKAVDFESAQVRSHLAAAYARARGKEFRADRERILSALMVPLLSNRGPNNVVEIQQFLTEAETLLALPKAFDSSHLTEALKVLEKDGLIVMQGTELLIGDIGTPTELGKDANRLVDGVIARAKIRNRDSSLEGDRTLLEQIIVSSLALDGLHLAHTLMRQQPLDNDRLEAVVHEAISKIKFPLQHVAVARSSIVELITSPDPEEEQILVNISAVVFGTALLLGDPLSIDRASSAFQRGAYVDASVILPWLALGHPLQQAYDSILRSFDTKSIRVLAGYLNEVISHKRLALDAYEKIAGQGDTDVFRRYASLFELHNINVFLGGFAGTLELSQGETFGEYLSRVAPFDSEAELKRYLELRGLTVEDHTVRDRGIFGELKAALRDRSKFREDVVIAHDAAQLEVLRAVTEREARPHFVTADRALIRAASETSLRYLIPNILLPQQVAFLARMADRTTAGLQAFSRTLWTVGTTVADKIRRYYSDRILREYEAGLVEEIDTILDAIMKDMRNDGVDLSAETTKDPHLESERIKIFGRIDRFEPRFFQHMAEARERLKRDQE